MEFKFPSILRRYLLTLGEKKIKRFLLATFSGLACSFRVCSHILLKKISTLKCLPLITSRKLCGFLKYIYAPPFLYGSPRLSHSNDTPSLAVTSHFR